MARIFYRHYHLPDIESPSLTFAVKIEGSDHNQPSVQSFEFAWAMCSEEDNFSRKTGRDIALSRLNGGDSLVGIRNHDKPLIKDLMDTIASEMYVIGPDEFMMKTVDALEFFHLHEEFKAQLEHKNRPLWERVVLWFYGKPPVQNLLGW